MAATSQRREERARQFHHRFDRDGWLGQAGLWARCEEKCENVHFAYVAATSCPYTDKIRGWLLTSDMGRRNLNIFDIALMLVNTLQSPAHTALHRVCMYMYDVCYYNCASYVSVNEESKWLNIGKIK